MPEAFSILVGVGHVAAHTAAYISGASRLLKAAEVIGQLVSPGLEWVDSPLNMATHETYSRLNWILESLKNPGKPYYNEDRTHCYVTPKIRLMGGNELMAEYTENMKIISSLLEHKKELNKSPLINKEFIDNINKIVQGFMDRQMKIVNRCQALAYSTNIRHAMNSTNTINTVQPVVNKTNHQHHWLLTRHEVAKSVMMHFTEHKDSLKKDLVQCGYRKLAGQLDEAMDSSVLEDIKRSNVKQTAFNKETYQELPQYQSSLKKHSLIEAKMEDKEQVKESKPSVIKTKDNKFR